MAAGFARLRDLNTLESPILHENITNSSGRRGVHRNSGLRGVFCLSAGDGIGPDDGLRARRIGRPTSRRPRLTPRNPEEKLLLDFTGSDWCIYCQKLDAEVLATPEFKSFAKDYVLVCVDFPKAKELPAAEKKQNDALGERFKIEGYPTLIVTDASGTEIRRAVGYEPGSGPRAYLAQLAPN